MGDGRGTRPASLRPQGGLLQRKNPHGRQQHGSFKLHRAGSVAGRIDFWPIQVSPNALKATL